MSKTMPSARIPLLLALLTSFSISGVQAQSQSQKDIDDAFKAVDEVLQQKDLNEIPDYKDDRSTPEALIASFYNAINRGEFARAYSYHSGSLPDFAIWVLGYKDTRSIKLLTGSAEEDPGAGVLHYYLPVAIEAENYDGEKEVFGGCYNISMAAPLNQEAPPFQPMKIDVGSLKESNESLEDSVPKTCMTE